MNLATAEEAVPEVMALGRRLLDETLPRDARQSALKTRLSAYAGDEGFLGPGDEAGWVSCVLAFASLSCGNFGIGALIADAAGRVFASGHNEICTPRFRSDAHAEMVVISEFETRWPNASKSGLALYTSLEPCPMCYTRILISGLTRVFWVADDEAGGMARRAHLMPDYWRAMEGRCRFERAETRAPLRALALDILNYNLDDLGSTVELRPLPGVSSARRG
ncbi:MAG: nucleoside deaminase [Hyphomicrobiales bacterium]|nr:MAG: nucleoside deaminase [Hyphomicrobiales bacterium]